MLPLQFLVCLGAVLSCYAATCPPMEILFLLDQSETARYAASTDPKSLTTKFDILADQLKAIATNPSVNNSANVTFQAFGYTGSDSLPLTKGWIRPVDFYKQLSNQSIPLNTLSPSGSWTYYGLRNVVVGPTFTNSIIFLVTAQGSGTAKRNLTTTDLLRVKKLNWKIKVLAMQSYNPWDTIELKAIDPNVTYINETASRKSYYYLADNVNAFLNGICTINPPSITTTRTSTTTSTTTTTKPPTNAPTTVTSTSTTTTTSTTTKTSTTTAATTKTTTVDSRTYKVCDTCLYSSGYGYDMDPDYCDSFYQCIQGGTPVRKLCPAGTFWDGSTCNYIRSVQCQLALCTAKQQNVTYPSGRCCNKYYECYNSSLYENTCPNGQVYDAVLKKCIFVTATAKSATCGEKGRYECDIISSGTTPSPTVRDCNGYSAYPTGDPCRYIFGGYTFKTAPGTVWSQSACSLVLDLANRCNPAPVINRDLDTSNTTCNANFLASFTGGSRLVYNERTGAFMDIYSIQQEVQLINDGVVFYNETSNPFFYYFYFINKDMLENTAYRVRFSLRNGIVGRTYDILSNNYCYMCPVSTSFRVYQINSNSFNVYASFVTTSNAVIETSAAIYNVNPNNMLEMIVVFGNVSVYGKLYEVSPTNAVIRSLNFETKSKIEGDRIATTKCGIQLGKGPNNHFVGIIDEFAVYERCNNVTLAIR